MKTSLSSKGQIVLPAELRHQDSLRAGQLFEVERLESGEYLLKKIAAAGRPGLLNWLARCPEPNWFRPLTSESTSEL